MTKRLKGAARQQDMLQWVERVAKYFSDQGGMPLIAGRILGWLMICEPPEQSAEQIAKAISASRASLTTNLRLLASMGFVRQITKPGRRTVFYRIEDGGWETIVRQQVASLAFLSDITRDGLEIVGRNTARAARIRAAERVFRWMQKVFADAPPLPPLEREQGE